MTRNYDAIGNPTTYRGATLTWNGRRLTSYNGNGVSASYTYSEDGIRTSKTVNGVTTEYFLSGSTILAEKTGDSIILVLLRILKFFVRNTLKKGWSHETL